MLINNRNIMRALFKVLVIALFLAGAECAAGQATQRVPAAPYPIEVVQPDSSVLTVRLHGDERFSFTTTADGYTVVKNKKGYYCYARVGCGGKIVATRRVARDAKERSEADLRYLEKMRRNAKLYREL